MFEKFLYRNYITTASQIMVRRSCFDQLGLFDESLPIVDDYDFYLRLSRCYDIHYDPRVLTHWRSHQFNTSKNYEKTQLGRIKVKETALNRWALSDNQKKILFKGLRRDYYELAYYYLNSEKYSDARNYFRKAVPYRPVKSIVYYLSTCVPGLSYLNMKALKNDFLK
ncbi:glycosyl transferase family protein [Geobacter metallireducens RCH3]|nr:glycosyl transferase family protein [Geobacter metallireducens RCH3]